jgi:hypothetical protein
MEQTSLTAFENPQPTKPIAPTAFENHPQATAPEAHNM